MNSVLKTLEVVSEITNKTDRRLAGFFQRPSPVLVELVNDDGDYIVEKTKIHECEHSQVFVAEVYEGVHRVTPHVHETSTMHVVVLYGRVKNLDTIYKPGDTYTIPPGEPHTLEGCGESAKCIVIFVPPEGLFQ